MKKIIAVSGKGGIGKSTLAALITRVLSDRADHKLLLVDADPSINLTLMLGLDVNKTLNNLRERFVKSAEAAQEAMFGDKHIRDTIFEECLQDAGTFKLLTMGRPEGPGCFCSVNVLLRYGIESISKEFDVTIIDCEAGPEQINRRVTKNIDDLILVIEPTLRSVQTALYIKDVAESYGVQKSFGCNIILNKADKKDRIEKIRSVLKKEGTEISGIVPMDENIAKYDVIGKSIFDLPGESPSVKSVKEIMKTLYT
ncbi:MAG: AAA family ATPase [Desulfosarcina sp.]|nr:AAA family ATPase [Desulfobacterales bacterium]